jgi:serine/threonine-protein kinase
MALTIGSRLGFHEITALLGKGGMGEVYRARDLKLKREVAIKILPAEFARDADRISRFQREAEVLASLNHPNIAGIHDLQEANGTRYLVLELVEGETLSDRIARGPISVDEALTIAIQICEALAAAHERGIVHRDLKPANIKVSPECKVKVLDFGLAKIGESFAASDLSNSPTRITAATSDMLLGTAAYMSPQQARGQSVDKRTDIWSFGCVMYEMLTGRQAFEGETTSDVVARILEREPDWSKLPARTPPAVQRLIRRCLIKNSKGRLQDIGDAHIELDEAAMPDRDVTHAVARVTTRERIAWALTMVFGVSLAALFWFWQHSAPSNQMTSQPLVHIDLDLGPNAPQRGLGANVVLSPDGSRLVFATVGTDGMTHLFVRRLDQPKSTQLTDTDGAFAPFFAPDGQWVGFFAHGKLKKVSVDGGTVTALCDAPTPRGASWGDDGNIVLTPDVQTPLLRVSASGGDTPVPLTTSPVAAGAARLEGSSLHRADGREFRCVRSSQHRSHGATRRQPKNAAQRG